MWLSCSLCRANVRTVHSDTLWQLHPHRILLRPGKELSKGSPTAAWLQNMGLGARYGQHRAALPATLQPRCEETSGCKHVPWLLAVTSRPGLV